MRLPPLVWLTASYLIGSIPFAYLAGRLLSGIDLRRHGSGNLGATNVARVIGWPAALAVFVSDAAKGALPVWLFPRWSNTERPELWAIAYGVAAIAGHVRPAFLGWTPGGKGVATAAGVFLALAPRPTLVATAVFAILLGIWRYVSLASLGAAITLPIAMALDRGPSSPLFVVSLLVCAFVFWTHRSNIERLRRGQEHRFGRKSPA
jgi:glycerol-3-phosphate acyltransferase PlsY